MIKLLLINTVGKFKSKEIIFPFKNMRILLFILERNHVFKKKISEINI